MTLSKPSAPSPYRSSILLSYLCTMLLWGATYIYMPILTPYTKHISGSLQGAGLVIGAYGLSQMILRIPLGVFSDRWRRRKPLILLGFIFNSLSNLGLILSSSTSMLFWSVFTAGIASSIWGPFMVLYSSYFPAGQIVHSMSLLMSFSRLSQIISTYAGGAIAENWGWTAPFYVGGVLSLVGLLLANGLTEVRPQKSFDLTIQKVFQVGRNRTLLMASFLCILMQSANSSSAFGFTPILAQQLGASKEDLGILLFFYLLPNTLATLLSGTVIRLYLAERLILIVGFLLISTALFITPFVDRLSFLKAIQVVNGAGIGLLFPLLTSLSIQSVPREQQATAIGFFQSLYAIGMTFGPILSGVFAQKLGLASVFVLNGLMCLAGAAFSFYRMPLSSREES